MVSELTALRNQAFAGATSIAYPVLDADYAARLLERLRAEGLTIQPSLEILDELREQVWARCGLQIQQVLREERGTAVPVAGDIDIDEADVPF